MQVKYKLIWLVGGLVGLLGSAACGSTGGGNNSGGGSNTGCTPGTTNSCLCVGGTMGVQTCKDDGRGYGACDCGTATSSSSSGSGGASSSSSGAMATCGDHIIEASDHCDNPSSEFYCKTDCENQPDAGTGGAGGMMDPCAGHVYYAGKFDGAISVWASLPAAGGMSGLDAGNAQCKVATNGSADHVCDYEEVLKAKAQGELAGIAAGTTAWIQRTTVAMVNGQPSQPGPGGRCNNWTYATNHISDGEYFTFDTAGNPTEHLDNDTIFDAANPGVHTLTDLPCGGATRSILCCYTACN